MSDTAINSTAAGDGESTSPERASDSAFSVARGSLKRKSFFSTLWFIGAMIVNKGIALVSNLILTRLLAPEIFGVMAIVGAIRQGIVMFTDLGLRGKMIEDKRSNEPYFYNTLWTYRFIRQWVLFFILCALAYPMALVYDEPDLVWVIPLVCLGLPIRSFSTIAMGLLSRNLEMRKPMAVNVCLSVLTVVVTATWAYFDPTIRALVAGVLFRAVGITVVSYFIVPGFRNRFWWDKEVMRSVVRFGRWVILSTGARFLLAHGDRLLLGLVLTQTELGFYVIALILAGAGVELVRALSNHILQVVYARLNDQSTKRLKVRMTHIRWGLLLLTMPAMAVLAVLGNHVVAFLYEPTYYEVGWMLQLLAVAGAVEVVMLSSTTAIMSRGDSFRFMVFQVSFGLISVGSILVGFSIGGIFGVIVSRFIANMIAYPIAAWGLDAHGIWMKWQDLIAMVIFVLLVTIGIAVLPWLPMPHELGL